MLDILTFKFSNGQTRKLTESGAERYCKDYKCSILEAYKDKRPRIKDGFQEGWNPALGMYIKSKDHFKRVLKERGLVEIGNEQVSSHEEDVRRIEKENWDSLFTDKTLREIANDIGGLGLSDGDIRYLKDSN